MPNDNSRMITLVVCSGEHAQSIVLEIYAFSGVSLRLLQFRHWAQKACGVSLIEP